MIYLGVDLSLARLDLAGVTATGDWCLATVPITPSPIPGRHLHTDLAKHLGASWADQIACVWIEQPYYNRLNPSTYGKLSQLAGALAATIPPHIIVDQIRPSVWRTELGIPGNARRADAKQAALAWARATLPPDALHHLTSDQADAACIAYTCLRQSERAAA